LKNTIRVLKPRQNSDIFKVMAHYNGYNAPKCDKIKRFGALSAYYSNLFSYICTMNEIL